MLGATCHRGQSTTGHAGDTGADSLDIDRHTEIRRDRQTDTETDTQRDRQTDGHTDRQTDKQTGIDTNICR